MNRVVHFEIHADDMKRAAAFYEAVFGWTIGTWPGEETDYITVMTAEMDSPEPGINGGIVQRQQGAGSAVCGANAFVCTVQVEDYDAIAAKIMEAGGKEVMGKTAIPGMAWQGYFLDTEGNTFGIHQPDANASGC